MMKQQDCGALMEALAVTFNYLSLAAINNLWRWLALSFWKIRSGNSPNKPQLFSQNKPQDEMMTDTDDDHDDEEASASPPPPPPSVVDVDEGPTPSPRKGKFTVYYYEEEHVEVEQEAEAMDAYDEWEEHSSEWWESWEGFLKLRLGHNHNGWYTSLDFKTINGNLVALWHPHNNQHYVCELPIHY